MTVPVADLHGAILVLAILATAHCAVLMVYGLLFKRNPHKVAFRLITILSMAILGTVWFGQLTGLLDLGPQSQSIALIGILVLIGLRDADFYIGGMLK